MSFSQRLREVRESRGMTQSDLARASGLTRAAISKWENAESGSPSAHAVQRAADVLSVSVAWLLSDDFKKSKPFVEDLTKRLRICASDLENFKSLKLTEHQKDNLMNTLTFMSDYVRNRK